MAWKLAPALDQLFKEVNARWPRRDKSTDGTIGDDSHSARKSEHNPNRDPSDNVPDGYVTAADIDVTGIDVARLKAALIGDKRVWYVIHDRKIYSRTNDFRALAYAGSNPHTSHVHVSLVQTKAACNDTSSWGLTIAPKPVETPYQRMARIAHQRMDKIRNLQKRLKRAKRG